MKQNKGKQEYYIWWDTAEHDCNQATLTYLGRPAPFTKFVIISQTKGKQKEVYCQLTYRSGRGPNKNGERQNKGKNKGVVPKRNEMVVEQA